MDAALCDGNGTVVGADAGAAYGEAVKDGAGASIGACNFHPVLNAANDISASVDGADI